MAKNVLQAVHFLEAGDLSSDFTSEAIYIQYVDNVGIELVLTTADAVGDFAVEISIDHVEQQNVVVVAGNWVALPLSPTPVAAGVNDSIYIDLNQMSGSYVRLTYTATSGSGSVEGYIAAKGI